MMRAQWLDEYFPQSVKSTDRKNMSSNSSSSCMKDIGITFDESANARLINRTVTEQPEVVKEVISLQLIRLFLMK